MVERSMHSSGGSSFYTLSPRPHPSIRHNIFSLISLFTSLVLCCSLTLRFRFCNKVLDKLLFISALSLDRRGSLLLSACGEHADETGGAKGDHSKDVRADLAAKNVVLNDHCGVGVRVKELSG